ncbi:MAG: tetraacyldisaccharide 4'-kinase [Myxococcaceae bacterium]
MSWLESLWYPSGPASVPTQLLRVPLAPLSACFSAGVRLRNLLFESGLWRTQAVAGLRVLSVGNLTVGGAGKTPVVAFLAERLQRTGAQVAVLSRGHGRRTGGLRRVTGPPWPSVEEVGDEPLLLARRLPGVSVWVGADKVALARAARAAGASVALLDDGFQHRRLARAADVVVLDEAVGLGSGHLLPWGPLREPPSALGRASLLWLRVATPAAPLPSLPPTLPRVLARHAAVDVLGPGGQVLPLGQLAHARVLAFCGIARPSAFSRTVGELGAEVTGLRGFADHHPFTLAELAALQTAAHASGAVLVTTEKDAMRLPVDFPAWVVRLGVSVLQGEDVLAALLSGQPPASAEGPQGRP